MSRGKVPHTSFEDFCISYFFWSDLPGFPIRLTEKYRRFIWLTISVKSKFEIVSDDEIIISKVSRCLIRFFYCIEIFPDIFHFDIEEWDEIVTIFLCDHEVGLIPIACLILMFYAISLWFREYFSQIILERCTVAIFWACYREEWREVFEISLDWWHERILRKTKISPNWIYPPLTPHSFSL